MTDTNLETGQQKGIFKPSKAFFYFSIFVFIIFALVGGMIYFMGIVAVQEGKMHFSGDIRILYWVIAIILLLGAMMVGLALTLSKGKTYIVYENGIVVRDKHGERMLWFKELDDLYLFSSGRSFVTNNIAFRKREDQQWEVITARYGKVLSAIKLITERHEQINVPAHLQHLANGGTLTFNYISYKESAVKKLLSTGTQSFLKVKTNDIILAETYLVIDGQKIMIKDLKRFSTNNLLGRISLHDDADQVVFSTATNGIFSGKTFIVLLDKLVNEQKVY